MAVEIVWSDEAKEDIQRLLDFIAAENPTAAANYVRGLEDACQKLVDFPQAGRLYRDEARCIVFRNHIILYSYEEQTGQALILTVADGRRDLDTLLVDRP
ncbi:type II toxin-antitoxin system RelE/ParE family toxin [Chelativorans xinjiangense]|uniref:type II toxin-antitoxin system RelE/ParE family toxin n=1 Tax=Chelativorans xinjiangense TaxID=2681485 RepID=UPI00135CAF09|nr:type II toxin-antitoxin system RelE/ParE family toxin [Chelativorans xinjiangense]